VKVSTSALVAAAREKVFTAVNDPEVLRRSIPGCEELTVIDAESFDVRVSLGLAGIKGRYTARVSRRDLHPPEWYGLVFDGKGKTGFVRGSALIRLAEEGDHSQVDCEADVQIGGAIAAVGSRLLEAAARKLTRDFFRRLGAEIGVPSETVADD
jgi:carbon monoxide dehydrogenase subunit G